MSTAALRRRADRLHKSSTTISPEQNAACNLGKVLKKPGVFDRLRHIAEHGASDDDLEWLDEESKETGADLHAVVAAIVELEEEY